MCLHPPFSVPQSLLAVDVTGYKNYEKIYTEVAQWEGGGTQELDTLILWLFRVLWYRLESLGSTKDQLTRPAGSTQYYLNGRRIYVSSPSPSVPQSLLAVDVTGYFD